MERSVQANIGRVFTMEHITTCDWCVYFQLGARTMSAPVPVQSYLQEVALLLIYDHGQVQQQGKSFATLFMAM